MLHWLGSVRFHDGFLDCEEGAMIRNHLHLAAYDGQADVVKKLLRSTSNKKNINSKDKNGWCPLHCASARGHLKVCKLLLENGAEVTAKNLDGATALHYLARIQTPENGKEYIDLLKLMLKKGAMVNDSNRHKETALHQAAMKGATVALEFLVQHGAEVNLQNEFGETALHYAVRLGSVKCIECLLAADADVFLEGREEGSALTLAEVTGQAEILAMMKKSQSYMRHVKKYGDGTLRGAAKHTDARVKQQPGTVPLTSKKEAPVVASASALTNVAFGIARGKCLDDGCDCHMYQTQPQQGGMCQNCGHFPVKHTKLQNNDEPALVTERAAAQEEVQRLDAVMSKSGFGSNDFQHSWTLDGSELKFESMLGEGTAAKVYKGKYRGQEVAIKVLKESLDPNQMADFTKEFQIYSDLRSPHVVLFFGACTKPEMCLVFEYCCRGSLFDVLNSEEEEMDWSRVYKLSLDVSKALNTLHSWVPSIVHRDMKSLNLLVDSNWTVKVSDFGLSRFTDGAASNLSTLGKLRGTYAYSAPEVYFGDPFTTKADVFSVGVIFWEMAVRVMTGEYHMPYSEYPELVFDFQIIIQVAKNGKRPSIPPGVPAEYQELITQCWAQQKDDRPEIAEVLQKLEKMSVKK